LPVHFENSKHKTKSGGCVMPSGGKREGAGRPRGEETKLMRIPVSAIPDIRDYLHQRKQQPPIRIAPLESVRMLGDYARVDAANSLTIPLVGSRVAAGFPSPADDYIEEYLDLNSPAGQREGSHLHRAREEGKREHD
jgi:hypothetical protein